MKTTRTRTKNRIYVLDNGGEYSDHNVWYIEADSGYDQNVVEQALLAASPGSFIVFSAKSVDWHDRDSGEAIESFLKPLDFFVPDQEGSYLIQFSEDRKLHRRSSLWDVVSRDFVETLMFRWGEMNRRDCVNVSARASIVEYLAKLGKELPSTDRPTRFSRF